jgi:hypothetical protein
MHFEKSRLVDFVFILVVAATFGTIAVRAVGEEVAALGPSLGDIVSFAGVPGDPNAALVLNVARAGAPSGPTCTLDSAVMARSGGSLFVEATSATAGMFRVHWAGGATNRGPAGCGPSADLLLSVDQIRELASKVGGFGAPGARGNDPQADAGVPSGPE